MSYYAGSMDRVNRIVALAVKNAKEKQEEKYNTVSLVFNGLELSNDECGSVYYELINKRGYYCVIFSKKGSTMIKMGWGDSSPFENVVNHELNKDDGWEVV